MKLTEDAWFIIRNTPGVTGFVGAGTNPTPVSAKEIAKIKKRMGVNEPKHDIDLQIGEIVNVNDGPFKGFDGSVSEIDPVKGKIKVLVSMFGRDTSVELDALQVKKV
jgi:transcriptional antiterminator NusG